MTAKRDTFEIENGLGRNGRRDRITVNIDIWDSKFLDKI
jgi:hypothetical protein